MKTNYWGERSEVGLFRQWLGNPGRRACKADNTAQVWALCAINHRGRQKAPGGSDMTKTLSIRTDSDNYEFLNQITKEERSDLSKTVRDLVSRGGVMLAVERYKNGQASLGRAAALAGLRVGDFMTVLAEFGVENRIDHEDYRRSLESVANTL
jgi:predicted HTH domain antitoxin